MACPASPILLELGPICRGSSARSSRPFTASFCAWWPVSAAPSLTEGQPSVSNAVVLQWLGAPHPLCALTAARLRMVAKVARFAPPFLVAVLQGPGGARWTNDVTDACLFLHRLLPGKLGGMPPLSMDMAAWQHLWVAFPAE